MTDMDSEQHQRYVRWADYRVNHLSHSINLFLGFAVASLAYAISLKIEGDFITCVLDVSIIIFGTSVFFGCLATVTKLLDYRHTARKIKHGGTINEFIADHIGALTWMLFWLQLFVYAFGALVFICGVFYV